MGISTPSPPCDNKYTISCVWQQTLDYPFNKLVTGQVFREPALCLVTASESGNVKVHSATFNDSRHVCGFEKTGRSYETKGGPVQSLLSHNVTKFSSEDVLVGDSNGVFTIITNGQLLNRRSLCTGNITSIVIDTDSVGNMSIVMGSSDGTLVAVTPYEVLWKCRLSEVLKQDEQPSENSVLSITAVHRYHMQNSTADASYIIVADSEKRIHLFQNGRLVMTMAVPGIVTSMCSGFFINEGSNDALNQSGSSPVKGQRFKGDDQVMLATKSGALFVMSNFNILLYANLSYPVINIKLLPATGAEDVDAVVASGYFNKLCILQNRRTVCSYSTGDWIHTFDMIDEQYGSGEYPLIVVGCLDGSLKILKLQKVT